MCVLESADEFTVLEYHRESFMGACAGRLGKCKKSVPVFFKIGRGINQKRSILLEKFFYEAAEFATGFRVYSKTSCGRRREHSLMDKGSKFLFYTE